MASWIQTVILFVTLGFLIFQTRTFIEQTKNQEKAINLQTEAMKATEYLGYLSGWTETKRSLLINNLYTKINDDLVNQSNSRYANWNKYSDQNKITYAYFELIYDFFERIFMLQRQEWISNEDWSYWLKWLEEIMYHPLFEDVHSDNLGMYDREFQEFISDKLKITKSNNLN